MTVVIIMLFSGENHGERQNWTQPQRLRTWCDLHSLFWCHAWMTASTGRTRPFRLMPSISPLSRRLNPVTGPSAWNEASVCIQAEISRPLTPTQPSIGILAESFHPRLRMASQSGVESKFQSKERRVAASFAEPSMLRMSPALAALINVVHSAESSPVERRK